jgi:hypothetical protein
MNRVLPCLLNQALLSCYPIQDSSIGIGGGLFGSPAFCITYVSELSHYQDSCSGTLCLSLSAALVTLQVARAFSLARLMQWYPLPQSLSCPGYFTSCQSFLIIKARAVVPSASVSQLPWSLYKLPELWAF